jgi:propionate CoA-transferase
MPLDERKVIARRAAQELFPGAVCNLGAGISTGIASIAAEEGVLDQVCLTNEQGMIGGAPAAGGDAGASRNYSAMVDQPYQFDFYDGGGLDLAFLSFAEVDAEGNVNVSRFGNRIVGPGGFINISQNARCVIFSGTLAAGALKISWPEGQTRIETDGLQKKFVEKVQQITFNGRYAIQQQQRVFYITERAVFRLSEGGVELIEVAPNVDLDRDIFDRMGFRPLVSPQLKTMSPGIFQPKPFGLSASLEGKPGKRIPVRFRDVDDRAAAN